MNRYLSFKIYKLFLISLFIFSIICLPSFGQNKLLYDDLQLTQEEEESVNESENKEFVIAIYSGDDESAFIFERIENIFDLHFRYEVFDTFPLMFQAVCEGDVDFISNITRTKDREKLFDYSNPVSSDDLYLYSIDANLINHISGKNIGFQNGTVYKELIEEYLPEVNIISFENHGEYLELLETGAIDGAVMNRINIENSLKNGYHAELINHIIPAKSVAIVAQKNLHTELLSAISKYISTSEFRNEMQQYTNSKYNTLIKNHIKLLADQTLTESEKKVVFKFENNPPFSFYNSDGELTGVFPDIAKEACDLLGIECIIVSEENESWDSMYQDLIDGDIDVLSATSKTLEREDIFYFSDAIMINSYHMVKRSDYKTSYTELSQLDFERIGLIRESAKSKVVKNQFPFKEFSYYKTNTELIEGLISSEIDYIILNENIFYDYVTKNDDISIVIDNKIDTIMTYEMCFAFPKTERGEALKCLFNNAISVIDVDNIVNKYVAQSNLLVYYHNYKVFNKLTIIFLSATIAILGLLYFMLKRNNHKLKYINEHDYLTNLFNREGLVNQIKKMKKNSKVAVLYMDLDNFEHYNDLGGHWLGDQILIHIAKKLSQLENNKVIASRFGGDEFVFTFASDNNQEIEEIAKLIKNLTKDNINIDLFKINITASIGVAMYYADRDDLDIVFENAEFAMRIAKEEKETNIVYFDQKIKDSKMVETNIVDMLRSCMKNEGFEMVYQPIVNIETNEIVALEALLRIKDNKMSPGVFVPIAEKNGLMGEIGRIVINLVLKQISLWKDMNIEIVTTYINFAPIQLYDQTIVDYLVNLLEKYQVEPQLIGIEIIEDVFLDKKDIVINTLRELKELGVNTSIDDFGSGQAGVNYLTNFEVDIVKVGKDVADKYLNHESVIVYETVVKLCRTLGFTVLAEGIETNEQIELVRDMDVDFCQGYFYYRPQKADSIEKILEKTSNL